MGVFKRGIVVPVTSPAFAYRLAGALLIAFLTLLGAAQTAQAQFFDPGNPEVSHLLETIVENLQNLPFLVSAFSYILGLLFAVSAIFKVKEHVEDPKSTPIRQPVARFLIGGALFALPIVFEAMRNTFAGEAGRDLTFGNVDQNWGSWLSSLLGTVSAYIPTLNLNNVLANFVTAIQDIPFFISAIAYLLGLLFAVAGILKLKEHIEKPDDVPLREPVIRLLAGGALFALPAIYKAMRDLVELEGLNALMGNIQSLLGTFGVLFSTYDESLCLPASIGPIAIPGQSTLGASVCNIILNTGAFPAFLVVLAYAIGMVLGVWGILKIKAHVQDPSKTPISEGLVRFLAGGLFFTLPMVVEIVRATVTPMSLMITGIFPTTGFSEPPGLSGTCGALNSVGSTTGGLDWSLSCLMNDMFGPMHVITNFFAFSAGIILIMIGISRLLKSAQDGPKGPGGIGTIMTFVTGGALLSYNELVRAFTVTLGFGYATGTMTATRARLSYSAGLTGDEVMHAHMVISAILKFLIIIGLISFVRGIFIIRDVAEGNSQASLMAGMTHLIGGAVAVNLGPLLNAVQASLGIAQYGISFT